MVSSYFLLKIALFAHIVSTAHPVVVPAKEINQIQRIAKFIHHICDL